MVFVLLMVLLGAILTLVPEFIYLRDQFGWRMNTIFKVLLPGMDPMVFGGILWAGYANLSPQSDGQNQDRWWLLALISASFSGWELHLERFRRAETGRIRQFFLDYLNDPAAVD
jgi:hypothetical protein